VKNVLVVQTFLPHYRVPFFDRLHETLGREDICLRVAYGHPPRHDRDGYPDSRPALSFGMRTRNRWFGRLLLQPVLREILRAQLVIVEQANKHLLNYLLILFSRLGLKKVAFWGHGWNRQHPDPHSLAERVKRRLARFPDWWFAYTDSTARYLEEAGVKPGVITVVQNSLDLERFRAELSEVTDLHLDQARAGLGIPPDAVVGLYCGRLYREKDIPFLMRAAGEIRTRIPHFHLILIGEGPDRRIVERYAEGETWVHHVGARFGLEKALFFRLARVVLNPGMIGLGILDAFACGLPVITTERRTHSPEIDFLEHGRNGLMCRLVLSDYVDAAVGVLSDPSVHGRLSDGALASADRYSLDTMVENFTRGIVQCLAHGT
jgi:L-malate glycosyltransferase